MALFHSPYFQSGLNKARGFLSGLDDRVNLQDYFLNERKKWHLTGEDETRYLVETQICASLVKRLVF